MPQVSVTPANTRPAPTPPAEPDKGRMHELREQDAADHQRARPDAHLPLQGNDAALAARDRQPGRLPRQRAALDHQALRVARALQPGRGFRGPLARAAEQIDGSVLADALTDQMLGVQLVQGRELRAGHVDLLELGGSANVKHGQGRVISQALVQRGGRNGVHKKSGSLRIAMRRWAGKRNAAGVAARVRSSKKATPGSHPTTNPCPAPPRRWATVSGAFPGTRAAATPAHPPRFNARARNASRACRFARLPSARCSRHRTGRAAPGRPGRASSSSLRGPGP